MCGVYRKSLSGLLKPLCLMKDLVPYAKNNKLMLLIDNNF